MKINHVDLFSVGIDCTEKKVDIVVSDQRKELVSSLSLIMKDRSEKKVKIYFIEKKTVSYINNKVFKENVEKIHLSEGTIDENKRTLILTDHSIDFLSKIKEDNLSIYIEDYSYGSLTRLLSRAESTGYLKMQMYLHEFDYIKVSPLSLKKFATGIGAGKKDNMMYFFEKDYPEYELKTDDLVDAFYLSIYDETLVPKSVSKKKVKTKTKGEI